MQPLVPRAHKGMMDCDVQKEPIDPVNKEPRAYVDWKESRLRMQNCPNEMELMHIFKHRVRPYITTIITIMKWAICYVHRGNQHLTLIAPDFLLAGYLMAGVKESHPVPEPSAVVLNKDIRIKSKGRFTCVHWYNSGGTRLYLEEGEPGLGVRPPEYCIYLGNYLLQNRDSQYVSHQGYEEPKNRLNQMLITARKLSLRRLYFHRCVCLSTGGEGGMGGGGGLW